MKNQQVTGARSNEEKSSAEAKPLLAAVSRFKARQIAKQYISSLVVLYDGFYSELLTEEENKIIEDECIKIAIKLFPGDVHSSTSDIIRSVLQK